KRLFTSGSCVLAAWFAGANPALAAVLPDTPMRPVTNVYHGVTVVDNYRWLENFNDPEVKQWSAAQNAVTRTYLDNLPARSNIVKRLEKIYSQTAASYSGLQCRPGLLFAMKFQPPAQQPWLITLKSPNDLSSEHVVLDPNKLDPKGTTAIDFYVASLDGKRVAVSVSENGSQNGTLFIYDAATGQPLPDKIPRVNGATAGGSAAWSADGAGVYYTRYPAAGERPEADLDFFQQVYFHRLGTLLAQDRLEFGRDLPRIAEIALKSRDDGRYLLATVANGDGGEFALYLVGLDGQWKQLTSFTDQIKQGEFGKDNCLYLLSTKNAPHGKILRLALGTDVLNPNPNVNPVVVPSSEAVLENFCPTANGLYVEDLMGGPSQLRYVGGAGVLRVPVKDPISAVLEILSPKGDEVLFDSVSYTAPYAWSEFDAGTKKLRRTDLVGKSPDDFGNVEVLREFATSKDGTKIPMNIIRRKKIKLDGENPTILYGYGGYGISMTPAFAFFAARSFWLDHGGVYVVANLRGGGEFGEEWHKAGALTNKQNVFDDFAACAQWLIDKKYTQPSKLATEGGSNGGLLMGAFLTQHPNLARAVVSHVGIYDSLRTELEPNGAFNVTEFGSVQDPGQFQALYAYSPYHHVAEGARYPAILMLTGDNDGVVNPYNSRKFAARLQAASRDPFPSPVYLRTTAAAGHGFGSSLGERIAEEADVYAFLFDQLDVAWDKKSSAGGQDAEP
ncbi:MAG: prolyl oligopeptidase family serine peptidase, partial [Verrucomicrobiota bacterium]